MTTATSRIIIQFPVEIAAADTKRKGMDMDGTREALIKRLKGEGSSEAKE